jgi:hypothetical protein
VQHSSQNSRRASGSVKERWSARQERAADETMNGQANASLHLA